MKYAKIAVLALLVVALASCCNCRKGKSKVTTPFTKTQWQLVQLEGETIVAKGESYTITFSDDNKVNGRGDCNSYMGSYELNDGKLTLSKLASTMAFCPNQEQEGKFHKALARVNSYVIDGRVLMLLADGEAVLTFNPIVK